MMPLLNKLLSSRKNSKNRANSFLPLNIGIGTNDRNSLNFGVDQVRILLFRECERRGRKLLFDSVAVEKFCANSHQQSVKNNADQKTETHTEVTDEFIYKHERVARDDVSLLSEMVFGSVAMTYRGPSFKVHEMDSPSCIMCTKVFSVPEYNSCKQSEKHSDEGLGHSIIIDSNSSNGSMKTLVSQSNLSFSSGSGLSPELRKNSTCSSTGSGWDIDVPPPPGSSQSLESSGSSGIGSLTSLRRRWLRAVSTSLSRAESEDIFAAQHSGDSLHDNHSCDNYNRRQKTRLGLVMLIELTQGHERKLQMRLLEHVALLEGMLDRLCCCCFEHSKGNGNGLVPRMHRASTRCALWLLRLLMGAENSPFPLLWHELLLNSTTSIEERVNSLHNSLHRMCRLLDDIDTKSTNFFLSTVITAVLTHHLGWVHTVLSTHDRQLVETLRKQYPCNPLWAQLGDLYGALGNPMRLAHTVIAGGADKMDLINSILTFLSYFIRSSIVERRQEQRLSPQQDLQEAISVLEEWKRKRSSLRAGSPSPNFISQEDCLLGSTSSGVFQRKKSKRRVDDHQPNGYTVTSLHKALRSKSVDGKASKLKRSSTMQKDLDTYAMNSLKPEMEPRVKCGSFEEEMKPFLVSDVSRDEESSPVKIIVSETLSEFGESKAFLRRTVPLPDFERKLDSTDPEEVCIEAKIESLRRLDDNEFEAHKLRSDETDGSDFLLSAADLNSAAKEREVLFVLGAAEDKTMASKPGYTCQCSSAFARVPNTSAQLPEGVLRKIIQRNFPESSKSIQRPSSGSSSREKLSGFCPKCCGAGYSMSQGYEGSKLLLETPTNATEVLRTCGGSVGARGTRVQRSNSLEYLMEANNIVELPMPRWKTSGAKDKKDSVVEAGFSKTLIQAKVITSEDNRVANSYDTGYTWGFVLQGLAKNKKRKKKKETNRRDDEDHEAQDEWWRSIREEIGAAARFPVVDQPVSEALCILADLDTWQVGILSNTAPPKHPPIPVGMSRLVANMLEAFSYIWSKYRSPTHCVEILESKLREMWLRSEALAEMLMRADLCETSVATLTDALDLDAADVPLLLAVATTHSPQIAQRFGLTLA